MDAFLVKNKWKYVDFWKTIVFGGCYALMTVIYGFTTKEGIYGDILNWYEEPTTAALILLIVLPVIIILHCLFTLAKNKLSQSTNKSDDSNQEMTVNIVQSTAIRRK